MKNLLLLLFLTLSYALSLSAQVEEGSKRAMWKANLPGGNYMVSLSSITAVSNHTYLLDGAIVVTEVTIDTVGTTVARFYQLTPLTEYAGVSQGLLSETVEELTEKGEEITNIEASTMVQKKYPITTHAKTVEYQIRSLEALKELYRSVSRSLETGKSGRVEIP